MEPQVDLEMLALHILVTASANSGSLPLCDDSVIARIESVFDVAYYTQDSRDLLAGLNTVGLLIPIFADNVVSSCKFLWGILMQFHFVLFYMQHIDSIFLHNRHQKSSRQRPGPENL